MDPSSSSVGDMGACYSSGSVAGAVFGTLLTVLVLAGLAYLFWRFYWRRRRGKHLNLDTGERDDLTGVSVQGGAPGAVTNSPLGDRFAFDNPCFLSEDASPNRKNNKKGTPKIKVDGTPTGKANKNPKSEKASGTGRLGNWTFWSPLGALVGGGGGTNPKNNEKRRAFDDSFIGEPERVSVSLRGHDFTGLGFNVCGNMRDGIFVRDVLHRGPASESGQIAAGDRILSLGISFEHMVFEDALTILSYASPYEVLLQVEKGASLPGSTLLAGTDITSGQTSLKRNAASTVPTNLGSSQSPDKQRSIICHPFYRSQSIDDLDKIGKASINAKRAQQIAEMTQIKSGLQDEPTNVKGILNESDGLIRETEEAKMQRREVPSAHEEEDQHRREGMGSSPPHVGFPKFGVRVLPPSVGNQTIEKAGAGKSHNPGVSHPNNNNNPVVSKQQREGEDDRVPDMNVGIATPEPQKQNERNSMIEMGAEIESKRSGDHTDGGNDNKNNPLEKAMMEEEEEQIKRKNAEEESNPTREGNKHEEDVKMKEEDDGYLKMQNERSNTNTEGIMLDVPEEVCMAGMAAVTNRKAAGVYIPGHANKNSVTAELNTVETKGTEVGEKNLSAESEESGSEDGERLGAASPSNGGKRKKAPAPPSGDRDDVEMSVPPIARSTDVSEESSITGDEKKKKGGTRIELGLDHITIHHQPTGNPTESSMLEKLEKQAKDLADDFIEGEPSSTFVQEDNSSDMEVEEVPEKTKRATTTVSGGKAASLGDLSRLEGGEVHRPPRMRAGPSSGTVGAETGALLERAVSLDMGNAEEVVVGPLPPAAVGSAKKRKAPAPPAPSTCDDSDEIDGGARIEGRTDEGEYGNKEPRLSSGTTDTFGRRLKKSSDWGTMEEALLAGGSPSSSSTSSSTSAGRTILHLGSSVPSSFSSPPSSPPPNYPPVTHTSSPSLEEFETAETSAEVSTTRSEEEGRLENENVVSSAPRKIPRREISLQSSVITSSDVDGDRNVSSTTEMAAKPEEVVDSSPATTDNRVTVTTSTSIDDVDSTTFPIQLGQSLERDGVVQVEVTDNISGTEVADEDDSGRESFRSSFQRAREFFEREEEQPLATADEDDDITSSPPSLPTSPMPTMQVGSQPLSLHSTTTYISSMEDIPVIPGSDFEVPTTTGIQQHITEIQVRSVNNEDGKVIKTREVVVSSSPESERFGNLREMNSGNKERHSETSGEIKFSISPVQIPSEGENQSDMYISESSFPVTDNNARAVHQIGYMLTGNATSGILLQDGEVNRQIVDKPTDSRNVESSPTLNVTTILGSPTQNSGENGSRQEYISSSEIVGESVNPTVQIRMREGPSGWIPYRQRNSQGEEKKVGEGSKDSTESTRSISISKIPKRKPPVPPRKDNSSESPNKSSDSRTSNTSSSSVKTVVEVPTSYTKRLVQVHDMGGDESNQETDTRMQGQGLRRVSEREVIQITPQELDKVMMSHSQFLSHKRSDVSPTSKTVEQWIPGSSSTRTVVHRIVEQWVRDDEDGEVLVENVSGEVMGASGMEITATESNMEIPSNGILMTESSTTIESAPDSRRQNMSVTRILVDPEFGTSLGKTSESVTKTVMVSNLQVSGVETKPTVPTSSLHS